MEHFEKSIIPVIESVYPSFTPLERTVADFFIHNTDESDLSARHVSELLYVSEASLSRFAKKCGYTGYREFVYRYQEGLNAALPGTDDHIKQVLNTYQELLNKSYSLADRNEFYFSFAVAQKEPTRSVGCMFTVWEARDFLHRR